MRIGYFDCFSGASGDMIVGSLIGAGCETDFLQSQVDRLDLGVRLVVSSQTRHGLHGWGVSFESSSEDKPHRHLTAIEKMIQTAGFEKEVGERCVAVFRRIGEAEAKIHNVPIEKVHFHEVGAVDSICDIVCAVSGLQRLGIERLYSSALLFGSGIIDSAHGRLPLPAPAALEIAQGFPVERIDSGTELTTPTGAALIAELAEYSPGFNMIVERVGYGTGQRDLPDRPNMLRLVVGEATLPLSVDLVEIVETNIDDATPEQIGHLQQRLFDTGALDVFVTSVLMKKNRPGHKLTVICGMEQTKDVCDVILRESSTAGVRIRRESRQKLDYEFKFVDTQYGKIKIKFYFGGDIRKFSPEYEDVAQAATKAGVAFVKVYNAAVAAMNKLQGAGT